jgi:RHS repeat-associated protein
VRRGHKEIGSYGTASAAYAGSLLYFPNDAADNLNLSLNPLTQQYCQNNRLQVVGVRLGPAGGGTTRNCASSGDLLNLTMTYGSAGANDGNLTGESIVTPLNISQTFTYDAYNRVAKATEGTAPAWSQTYNYDPYGNRWVTSPVGFLLYPFTPTASANYNSNNQLAPAFHSSAYDLAGNQTGIGGYTFTYDAEGRQYSSAVNNTTTYTYDGEGRRVMKATTGGTTTVYVYDAAGQVAAEYSTAAPPQVGTLYLTPDHLGSTRLETNELGAAVAYHDYLPFGEEIPSGLGGRGSLYGAADGLTHKFTGKERDALETGGSAMQGLDYFGARYFSGAQGRFTSPDRPFVDQTESDPQSWNLYAYGRNNPLRYTDEDGQACVSTDGGKTYQDDNSGGQSCADADAANKKKTPDVTVTAKQGSAVWATTLNAFFALDNIANAWFRPLTNAMGVQPSYMQDTPVSNSGLGKTVNAAVVIGSYLLGPGEEEAGIAITEHAAAAMAEHNVTPAMVKKAIQVGEKFVDPKNDSTVYVVRKGMASGKDLAVAVSNTTGKLTTVMVNKSAVRPRFIPVN